MIIFNDTTTDSESYFDSILHGGGSPGVVDVPPKPASRPTSSKRQYRTMGDITPDFLGKGSSATRKKPAYRSMEDVYGKMLLDRLMRNPASESQPKPADTKKQYRTMADVTQKILGQGAPQTKQPQKQAPSNQPVKKPISPYVGVVEANRDLIVADGKKAFASLRNGLRQYNDAAKRFTASIRALQPGLSIRGKALLKRDIEELQGFKQVVQDTLNNFSIKMPAAK